MSWVAKLVLTGAAAQTLVAVAAFAAGGLLALLAALVGSTVALGAQIAAVAVLRPGMKAAAPEFNRRWATGIAARVASFALVAALMLGLKTTLPPLWTAVGYLTVLLSLLFAETRFLR
ncbi:MAG: hypothetical protein HY705_07900 [Gemmatimonadetes bacterium]|nr:hypothetical protein [Gemmatimonadota bacterium]